MERSELRQMIINILWKYEDLSEWEIEAIAIELTNRIYNALGL